VYVLNLKKLIEISLITYLSEPNLTFLLLHPLTHVGVDPFRLRGIRLLSLKIKNNYLKVKITFNNLLNQEAFNAMAYWPFLI
jgi:hypothetical protein